jgi:hypothetical protein
MEITNTDEKGQAGDRDLEIQCTGVDCSTATVRSLTSFDKSQLLVRKKRGQV